MDPWKALRPFYYVSSTEDCGGFVVTMLEHRTKGTFRVAYRVKSESRPRLSPETSQSMAQSFLGYAREDRRNGGKCVTLKHRLRIYAREIMPSRWKSHRKRMSALKERKQMENLPQFGLF